MKLFRILPLVVGSAAAGIFASTSPAQALNWNWSYSGTGVTASGTYTTTDVASGGYYTLTGITGTRNGNTITGLVPSRGGNSNVYTNNDLLLSQVGGLPTVDGFNYYVGGTTYGEVNLWNDSGTIKDYSASIASGVPVVYSASPVPFEIPGGATIPAFGGLLALAGMRKARRSIASKTCIAKPVTATVS